MKRWQPPIPKGAFVEALAPYPEARALLGLRRTGRHIQAICGSREQTREQIGNVLLKLDGKAEVKGFGRLELTNPTVTVSYDRAQIRALIDELVTEHPDIAARLVACQTKSHRAGSLRIERERGNG